MSIERQGSKITIVCDTMQCPVTFEGPEDFEWHEVWSAARAKGWRTRKIAGEWLHGCPDCGVPR